MSTTKLIITAEKEGYSPKQVQRTLTVEELIDLLSGFDPEAEVLLSFDNGYTYGGLRDERFQEKTPAEYED